VVWDTAPARLPLNACPSALPDDGTPFIQLPVLCLVSPLPVTGAADCDFPRRRLTKHAPHCACFACAFPCLLHRCHRFSRATHAAPTPAIPHTAAAAPPTPLYTPPLATTQHYKHCPGGLHCTTSWVTGLYAGATRRTYRLFVLLPFSWLTFICYTQYTVVADHTACWVQIA